MNAALRFVPLVLGLAVLQLQGCGPRPQNIRLDPPVQVARSDVGQGKVVMVEVKDARTRKALGTVGDLAGRYAHVSVEHDFSGNVYQRVAAALAQKGFSVQPTPGPDGRKLTIEVREMNYQSSKRTVTFETQTNVIVAGLARNETETYDRLYNAGERSTTALLPSESERSQAVNRAIARTIEDMLNDGRLIAVLAR